jgi:hypothetical protein
MSLDDDRVKDAVDAQPSDLALPEVPAADGDDKKLGGHRGTDRHCPNLLLSFLVVFIC